MVLMGHLCPFGIYLPMCVGLCKIIHKGLCGCMCVCACACARACTHVSVCVCVHAHRYKSLALFEIYLSARDRC